MERYFSAKKNTFSRIFKKEMAVLKMSEHLILVRCFFNFGIITLFSPILSFSRSRQIWHFQQNIFFLPFQKEMFKVVEFSKFLENV
jgi:hypothetical protein